MYFDNLNNIVKKYFEIFNEEIPSFLFDYVKTKAMSRLNHISFLSGTDYSKLFHPRFYYSRLDHSVAVSLIIWHFTHDEKQALAGLFHDISVPVFCHAIDYMNKDYLTQESTEEKTKEIICSSKDILKLLRRDNILLEDVIDYKIYPIADNKTPLLSADRLEYSLSTRLIWDETLELTEIKEIFDDIIIVKNENDISEMAFKNINIAKKFIFCNCFVAKNFQINEDKFVLQFLADLVQKMITKKIVTYDKLFIINEKEFISIIDNCIDKDVKEMWNFYLNVKEVKRSNKFIPNKYCIGFDVKKRYINPLVCNKDIKERAYNIDNDIKKMIDETLAFKDTAYVYVDYKKEKINA